MTANNGILPSLARTRGYHILAKRIYQFLQSSPDSETKRRIVAILAKAQRRKDGLL